MTDKIYKDNLYISLIFKTLNEDINGLFDYHSKKLVRTRGKINISCYVVRNKANMINTIKNQYSNSKEDEIIFRARKSLKPNKNVYQIINPIRKKLPKNEENIEKLNNNIWYVIKSKDEFYENKNEDYCLYENDIIKIGKKKYEITKFHFNNSFPEKNTSNGYNISERNKKAGEVFDMTLKANQYIIDESDEETNSESNEEKNECRICLDGSSSKDNPKLRICHCNDYIHFECLKTYLSHKIKIQENLKHTVTTYIYHKFRCDVCLEQYQTRFKIPNIDKIYELVDVNLPLEFDFLVLESLNEYDKNNKTKVIHVINLLNTEQISIGRNSLNDIVDKDTSVSREHAEILFDRDNGKLVLRNKSKRYGTLVLVKDNINVQEKEINFQVGRTYVTANLEKEENTENKV